MFFTIFSQAFFLVLIVERRRFAIRRRLGGSGYQLHWPGGG
jgi:hypothetical protein